MLLKLMAGLIEPSRGEVYCLGANLLTLRGKLRASTLRRVGFLFQKNALFDSLTALENVEFPLREALGLAAPECRERSEFLLEKVGLLSARDRLPSEMSGGMQKRLGVARALALKPEIVLYDDPTAGLDPITSRQILDLILTLQAEQQSTVVAVLNDMNRVRQMDAQNLMVIDREVLVLGDRHQIFDNDDPRVQQFIRGDVSGPLTVAK